VSSAYIRGTEVATEEAKERKMMVEKSV